jgi:hypothetical protein
MIDTGVSLMPWMVFHGSEKYVGVEVRGAVQAVVAI